MLILVILKLFILDLKILQGNTIVILLVSVGLILLGVAILIRRIRKKRKMIRPGTSSEVITRH
jgi:cytochrome c-type biogenesis protein CcmH/NrfF